MFVPVILGDSLQWLFGFRVPVAVGMAVAVVSLILALMGFVGAIRIRIRRRALPAWVLVAEVVLGIAWAGFVFAFYGVLTYSAIG
jgi:hypothetical protein